MDAASRWLLYHVPCSASSREKTAVIEMVRTGAAPLPACARRRDQPPCWLCSRSRLPSTSRADPLRVLAASWPALARAPGGRCCLRAHWLAAAQVQKIADDVNARRGFNASRAVRQRTRIIKSWHRHSMS